MQRFDPRISRISPNQTSEVAETSEVLIFRVRLRPRGGASRTRVLKQRKTIRGGLGERPVFWHLELEGRAKRQDSALEKGGLTSFGAKNRLFWGKAAFWTVDCFVKKWQKTMKKCDEITRCQRILGQIDELEGERINNFLE